MLAKAALAASFCDIVCERTLKKLNKRLDSFTSAENDRKKQKMTPAI